MGENEGSANKKVKPDSGSQSRKSGRRWSLVKKFWFKVVSRKFFLKGDISQYLIYKMWYLAIFHLFNSINAAIIFKIGLLEVFLLF